MLLIKCLYWNWYLVDWWSIKSKLVWFWEEQCWARISTHIHMYIIHTYTYVCLVQLWAIRVEIDSLRMVSHLAQQLLSPLHTKKQTRLQNWWKLLKVGYTGIKSKLQMVRVIQWCQHMCRILGGKAKVSCPAFLSHVPAQKIFPDKQFNLQRRYDVRRDA
jgi:hypothetical protein